MIVGGGSFRRKQVLGRMPAVAGVLLASERGSVALGSVEACLVEAASAEVEVLGGTDRIAYEPPALNLAEHEGPRSAFLLIEGLHFVAGAGFEPTTSGL